jgi:hypothetical protein
LQDKVEVSGHSTVYPDGIEPTDKLLKKISLAELSISETNIVHLCGFTMTLFSNLQKFQIASPLTVN